MSNLVPKDKRQLRACMICGIIQNHHTFREAGCPNCDKYIRMRGSNDMVTDCTSAIFDGMTALFQPEDSWVGKFAHLNNNVPGVYASHVTGRIPEDIEDTLAQKGFTYHPRDGSAEE